MFNYLKGVVKEFKRIKWPSSKITTYFTIGVILISVFFGIYMYLLDLTFVDIVKIFYL